MGKRCSGSNAAVYVLGILAWEPLNKVIRGGLRIFRIQSVSWLGGLGAGDCTLESESHHSPQGLMSP